MGFDLGDFLSNFPWPLIGPKAVLVDGFDIRMLKVGQIYAVSALRIAVQFTTKIETGQACGFADACPFFRFQGNTVRPCKTGGNKTNPMLPGTMLAIGHLRYLKWVKGRLGPFFRGKLKKTTSFCQLDIGCRTKFEKIDLLYFFI